MLFWLLLPLRLLGGTNILKKHAVFIFSPEDGDIMFLWDVSIQTQNNIVEL